MSKPIIDLSQQYKPHPRQILAHVANERFKLYGGAFGGGKCFALDTQIPTDNGWSTIGELKVGEFVFDEKGIPCKVLRKSNILLGNEVFKIEFDDGTILKTDAEHLWLTFSNDERVALTRRSEEFKLKRRLNRIKRGKGVRPDLVLKNSKLRKHLSKSLPEGTIRSTKEMYQNFICKNGANYSIKTCQPLQLPEKDLPLDPYLFGLWLGDGHSYGGAFSTSDIEILNTFKEQGYKPHKLKTKYDYTTTGLHSKLKRIGVIGNKHIPLIYLRASESQRRQLLIGLMDTDGYCAKDGGCEFNNTKINLSLSVLELARSLGIKCFWHERQAKLNGRYISQVYDVNFTTKQPVFKISRKANRQNKNESKRQTWHYIKNIIRIPTEPVQCIEVDSQSHLYLIGKSFIPTHNTIWLVNESKRLCIDYPGNVGYICRNELPAFRRSVLIELEKYLIPEIIQQHHQTENYFKFKNGSILFYGGLGDSISGLQRLSSMSLGFWAIDQAEETTETHFNMLAGRLRLQIPNIRYYGLLTCNPSPGWIKQKFVEQKLPDHVFIQSLPKDNPHLPADYEPSLRKIYPPEWVAAMLEGDWNALEGGNFLFQYKYLHSAINREIETSDKDLKWAGIDIAREGDDLSVFTLRQGNKVIYTDSWAKTDLMETTGIILNKIEKFELDAKHVNLDCVGVGAGVYDRLREQKVYINGIVAGGEPQDKEHYINQRAEMYDNLRKRLEESSISILDDQDLIAQLSSIRFKFASDKKLQIVSKEDMKRQYHLKSPDKADSLALAFYEPRLRNPQIRWL